MLKNVPLEGEIYYGVSCPMCQFRRTEREKDFVRHCRVCGYVFSIKEWIRSLEKFDKFYSVHMDFALTDLEVSGATILEHTMSGYRPPIEVSS